MTTWQEALEQRGAEEARREGRTEGMERGRLVGEILTWLRVRLGPVAPEIGARVQEAEIDQLRAWRAAVESVASLDELFGPEPRT